MTTMLTTSVGVRELKRDAARLVQRAARGERVLVTRYGKAAAQLLPAEIGSGRDESPRMRDWERERAAFARLEPRLRRRYRGRWVGIQTGRVVAVGGDPEGLARRLFRRLGNKAFFVGRVGAPPPLLDLPGFRLR
ncbi:MAG: type II toxin-antitoxin system prevent-host-death family antitoxin [Candidatus Rokubacteria bacterium]|nr:type II toxin-antitoxin system prevent-host-death family antitoxin [Candidatus Rokubacteria bacterium]